MLPVEAVCYVSFSKLSAPDRQPFVESGSDIGISSKWDRAKIIKHCFLKIYSLIAFLVRGRELAFGRGPG